MPEVSGSTAASSRKDFLSRFVPWKSMPQQQAITHSDYTHDTRLLGGRVASFITWPRFPLVDQNGAAVEFHRDVIRGRAVVIAFFYTQCKGSCPVTLGRMLEVEAYTRSRGREARFVSITLEPETDSPAALAQYSTDQLPAGSDWHLLTGNSETISALRRYLGFYDPDPILDADPRRHAAMVLMGDDRTHRWLSLPAIATARQWCSTLLRCTA